MTDWNKLKVTELRAELKKRGLLQTGLKPVLVARLAELENEEGSESEATVQALDVSSAAATSPDGVSPVIATADGIPDAPQTAELDAQTAEPEEKVDIAAEVEPQSEAVPAQAATIESSQATPKDQHTSALPSVEPLEANEDRQKRKRRSQSPPPSATDAARKRFRVSDEGTGISDEAGEAESGAGVADTKDVDDVKPVFTEQSHEGDRMEDVKGENEQIADADTEMAENPDAEGATYDDPATRTRDSRFKNLFPETTPAMGDVRESDEMEQERNIPPAIHPATSALYIRDFMRPLMPQQLKAHLASLAAPPGQEADPDAILSFFIDPIRTHAFVSFAKVSSASRVRSALHDRIWPDEKTRKPLWVDFVPAEKVDEWITIEEDTQAGGRGGKKWEVYYDTDGEGQAIVSLQEVGEVYRSSQPIRQPSITPLPTSQAPMTIPTGPRGNPTATSVGTSRLDKLFKVTENKPPLYWLPVSESLANSRLDSIDRSLSKEAKSGTALVGGDVNRYTFENANLLVDRGPEIFPGLRPPAGFRGPSGFGGSRGAFQPRGGYGGFRGGGMPRGGGGYDSYRGGRGGRDDRRPPRDFGGRY